MNTPRSDRTGSRRRACLQICLRTFSLAFLSAAWFIAGAAHAQASQKTMSRVSYPVQLVIKRCEVARAAGAEQFKSRENAAIRVSEKGEIDLVFHAVETAGPDEAKQLEALGARVVSILDMPPELEVGPIGIIRAWVPYDKVEQAAELPWVAAVMETEIGEPEADTENPIQSEGVILHNADFAHDMGVTGAGVTVGVISDGVDSLADAQDREELPDVTVLLNDEGGDEGTAMLEVIHDMAPDAALMFHTHGGSVVGHIDAYDNLFMSGADVIADDITWHHQPIFQQGAIAATRQATAAAGIPVHSSAGNAGNKHAARVPAVGTGSGPDGIEDGFTGCDYDPTNVVAIAPGGDTTFDMIVGPDVRITLQWSEPRAIFPTAGAGGFTDLDLYLMDATGTECLAMSANYQGGGTGDTLEYILTEDFPIPDNTHVKVVVNLYNSEGAVAPPTLDLHWWGSGEYDALDATTRASSVPGDKNYTGFAYAVGAVYVANAQLEAFSSAGPVEIMSTTVCPGGVYPCDAGIAGASATYQGVDFLGADGVSISGAGGFGYDFIACPAVDEGDCLFFGTSAAAPHTAACDTLLRSLPSFGVMAPPAATRERLVATAIDYGAPGEDSIFGAGLLDCFAAIGPPDANCSDRTVATDPGICAASGVSIDDGSGDPFGQDVTIVQLPPNPYDLGETTVHMSVTDEDLLKEWCVATVTVEDHELPTIVAPQDILAECETPAGTKVYLGHPESLDDNCDDSLFVTNDGVLEYYPLGSTTVTWTATDDSGNSGVDTQDVTVVDTTPPELSVVLSPDTLWAPNHKLVTITATVTATDICETEPAIQLVSVTSNEPDDGLGDGAMDDDIVIIDDFTIKVRAERSGLGDDRVYTFTYQAEDASGNVTVKSATVTVPHNDDE